MRLRSYAALSILVAVLLAAGCVSTPQPGLPAFQEAGNVSPGKALLIIYRDARYYGSMLLMPVACDGVVAAELPNGTALQYVVHPGTRTVGATLVGAQSPVRSAAINVEARAGARYFIKVAPTMGMTTVDVSLALLQPAQALAELETLRMIVGPGGETVLVETALPRSAAVASKAAPLSSTGESSPPGVRHTGVEAVGNLTRKIDSMLHSGAQVRLVVIMPEKDVSYHGPSFDMPMGAWQKKMASEIMAAWTAMVLQAFGEAPGFSVVNRENVRDILREFELQGSEAFDGQATARVGRMVGANHMLLLSFSRENISGNRYRDIRTIRLIDMEPNTILALDELADDLAVDTSTQSAVVLESRLNGRRYVQDPDTCRSYFVE